MAVVGVGVVAVGLPFLQLAPATDAVGCELGLHGLHAAGKGGVSAQHGGGIEVVLEQVPDDLLVVHDAVFARAVLG
jgi:hypothetical protein